MAQLNLPDGRTISFPDGLQPEQVRKIVAASSFAPRAAGMTHEQMVEAYRQTRPGDPWGDYLAQRIQQPIQGETPDQAAIRAGGQGSTGLTDMSTTGKAAATFLQGVPFAGEYADEALGAIAPLVGPNSAEQATQAIRGGQQQFAQDNPKTALGLKVGGGIAGSLPMLGMAPWLAPASMGGKIALGTVIGGAGGGVEGLVSGYGEGTDPQSRIDAAKSRGIIGALLGAGIGGAAPLVASGAKSALNWGLDQLNVARNARKAGLSKPSYEILTRTMGADGALSGRGAQRIAAAGPDAMLADAGPSARTVLDAAVQKSGPAAGAARQAIEQRASNANRNIAGALDATLGRPQGIKSMETAIRKGASPITKAAYDAAYAVPINYASQEGKSLQAMLRRVPQSAISQANLLMKLEGLQSKQILATVAPNGKVTYKRLPDVQQWDYITRALNQAAEAGDGAGALGGTTTLGRAYQNLSRDARSTLKTLVPEYAKALDTAAEPIAARQALLFGEKLLGRGTTRDEVATTLAGMSQAERTQAKAGVRSFIDEKLANVTRAITDGNMDAREAVAAVRDLTSRANREKVTALLGQQEADRLYKEVTRATMALELRAGVADNSRTFARTEMSRTIKDYQDTGVAAAIQNFDMTSPQKGLAKALLGGTAQAKQEAEDKIYSEIVKALTEHRGADAQRMLSTLQGIAVQNPKNKAIADLLAKSLTLSSAVPAYQTGSQYLRAQGAGQGPR